MNGLITGLWQPRYQIFFLSCQSTWFVDCCRDAKRFSNWKIWKKNWIAYPHHLSNFERKWWVQENNTTKTIRNVIFLKVQFSVPSWMLSLFFFVTHECESVFTRVCEWRLGCTLWVNRHSSESCEWLAFTMLPNCLMINVYQTKHRTITFNFF